MKKLVVTVISIIALCGCMATPKKEREVGYAIYNVKPLKKLSHRQIAEAVEKALQSSTSKLTVNHEIPPHPLPKKPNRFKLVSPFKGTRLELLAASSGQSLKVPTCDNAIVTINAVDSGMAQYGEKTKFFTCVHPYKGGHHIDIYTEFSEASGFFNEAILGATLARTVVGNSSKFIPRTLNNIVEELRAIGSEVSLVEAYP